MGDWPITDASRFIDSDATTGTIITASATPHTKGAWSQLVASLAADSGGILFTIIDNDANGSYLVDIGIGAAGSEVVLVPNIFLQEGLSAAGTTSRVVPIAIPGGTRVAARVQSNVASGQVRLKLAFLAGGFPLGPKFTNATDYGSSTASSNGTQIPGAAPPAKGAWIQLAASTSQAIRAALLCAGDDLLAAAAEEHYVDLGVGAAGSEQVVVPNVLWRSGVSTTFGGVGMALGAFPLTIPAGSRLAARAASVVANRTLQLSVIGFN